MSLPIQAVLFDYGMVLSGPPDPAAQARMHEVTGLDPAVFHRAYWAPRHAYDRGTHTGTAYWHEVGREAGITLTPAQVATLIEADTALWTQVNQPMIDWALRLQAAHIPTGILSNLGDEMTAGILAKFKWLSGFNHCLWSYTLKLAKPELEIYQAAAKGLGVAPENILFIDDKPENTAGGEAARMQVIQYSTLPAFLGELESRGLTHLWNPKAGRPVP